MRVLRDLSTQLTVTSDQAQFSISTLAPGAHTIDAVYSGDINNAAATGSVSITVTAQPSATISYAGPYCTSAVGAQSVTFSGTPGGTYSASPGGLTIDPSTGAITPSTSTAGAYTVTYTVAASGGCSVYTTTTNVTITAAPAATISYSAAAFCTSLAGGQAVTQTGTAGGTYSASPGGLSIDPSTGAITPSTSTAGTYTITYTVAASGGCSVFTTTTNVTITAAPAATISYSAAAFCTSLAGGQAVTQTGTAGGTYSASPGGLSIDPSTGAITPSTSAAGAYTVTYTVAPAGGCSVFTTTANVAITASPAATISYTGTPFCSSSTSQTVNFTGTAGGTFSAPAGVSINPSTGAINPSLSTPGGPYTITYNIPAGGGCAAFNITTSISITAAPTATINYAGAPFCRSVGTAQNVTRTGTAGGVYTFAPAGLSINGATGAITPSLSTAGTYTVTYTVAAANGCPAFVTTTSVTITAVPTATIGYTGSPFCSSSTNQAVNFTGTAGGTFSAPAGVSINPSTGAINPSLSTPGGPYTITYNIPAGGGCAAFNITTSISITAAPTATINYAGAPFCRSVGTAQNVTRTGTAGGTYTFAPAGLVINSGTGAITPSTSAAGTYTVTYTVAAANGCPAFVTTTSVTITAVPAATISYPGANFCTTNATPQNVTRTGTAGGTYTAPSALTINASTGAVTPSTSTAGTYTVTYTIAAAGGCAAVLTTTSVIISIPPVATATSNSPVCETTPDFPSTINLATPAVAGATYSWTGPGGFSSNIRNPSLTASISAGGTYTVTVTLNGCSSSSSTTVSITPKINDAVWAEFAVCQGVGTEFRITSPPTGGNGTYTYQWMKKGNCGNGGGASTAVPGANGPTYIPTDFSCYWLQVTSGACTLPQSLVGQTDRRRPDGTLGDITINGTPSAICTGSSTTLTASSPASYTYTWSPATGLNTITGPTVIASPTVTTTYTVTGTSTDGTGCQRTATFCVVVFPNAPTLTNPANTCNAAFSLPTVSAVAGFTVQYSIDGGAYSASPTIPNTVGCHNIQARYILTAACGATPAGATAPAGCAASNIVNAVIFPPAPPAPVVNAGCGAIVVTPPAAVAGFNIEYSFDDGVTWGTNTPPTASNCTGYLIRTRYVTSSACGSIPAGTASSLAGCNMSPSTLRRIDNVFPTATPLPDINVAGCNAALPAADIAIVQGADNCGPVTVAFVSDGAPSLVGCIETTIRTYSVTDACGNSINVTQNIIRTVDTQDPTATPLPDINVAGCNAALPAADIAIVQGADNCGPVTIAFVSDGAASLVGCIETTIRTYSVTDACGNSINVTQNIIRTVDTQDPTATPLPDINVTGCNAALPAADIAIVQGADNCGPVTVAFVGDGAPSLVGCIETTVRTYSVTDACGNSINVTQNIIRTVDTQDPTATPLPDIDVAGCNAALPAADIAIVQGADNCGPVTVAFVGDGAPSLVGCIETTVRTYSVTDACGNSINVTQNIIRTVDTQDPTATPLPDINVAGCNATLPAADIAIVQGADNCGPVTIAFVSDGAPSLVGCIETTIRTYSVTDACGNSINVTQNIIRTVDTQDPTATPLPDINVAGCNATLPAADIAIVQGADNCGSVTIAFVSDGAPALVGCVETTIRTYSVTDDCGNSINVTQNIIRNIDQTPPTASPLADINVNGCNVALPAPDINLVVAQDNCGTVTVAFVSDGAPALVGCVETTIRTYSVTDDCGNSINVTQNILRNVDNIDPVVSPLPDINLTGCNAVLPGADITLIQASDNCGNVTVAFVSDGAPTLVGCIETTVRNYSVTDDCGNTINVTQNIVRTVDQTPPTVTPLPALNVPGCNAVIPAPDISIVQATDNCGNVVIAFVSDGNPAISGCQEITVRTYSVTDDCGNQTIVTQNISRNISSSPPTAVPLPDLNVAGCNTTIPAPDITLVQAQANCSNVTVTFIGDGTPSLVGCIETTVRTYNISDECGNTINVTQNIIRTLDLTAPTANPLPDINITGCNAALPGADITLVQALDNCGAVIVALVGDGAPSVVGCIETTVRTYSVTDACGNSINVTQNIIRTIDQTPPVMSALSPASTINCDATLSWDTPTATDLCDPNVTLTFNDVTTPGACAGSYSITRTWTATDECGNTSTATQTINVEDVTAPVISALPPASTINCDATPSWDTPTATDLCDPNVTLTFNDVTTAGACAGSYSVTRTWTATDECGNTSTATQTINVEDVTPPTISALPGATTINCDATPSWDTPTATDLCDANVTLTFNDVTTAGACAGSLQHHPYMDRY